jgi:hypothetical protein
MDHVESMDHSIIVVVIDINDSGKPVCEVEIGATEIVTGY